MSKKTAPCPDCTYPMEWSDIIEAFWCMRCPDLPIKNWIEKDGKLEVIPNLGKHIDDLNKRDEKRRETEQS